MARRRVKIDNYAYVTVAANGRRDYHVAHKGDILELDAAEAARGDALGGLEVSVAAATGPASSFTGAPQVGDAPGYGQELAYAERTTNDTTTNLTATDAALMANLIAGLSFTIIGTGRPVDIIGQFRTRHSVANGFCSTVLMVNGISGGAMSYWCTAASPTSAGAVAASFRRRVLLADGTPYTFELGKQIGSAGTGTWEGQPYWPMSLSAVQR